MTEKQKLTRNDITPGRYIVAGKPAWVSCDDDGVRVKYDDGCFTAAFYDTFLKWNVSKID